MTFNIVVIEDQEMEQKRLIKLLDNWQIYSENALRIATYLSGEEFFEKNKTTDNINLFFLDIELNPDHDNSHMNGMEIAQKLRKEGYANEIVFLTSYKEYVFEGYEVRAFNYLLKPIEIHTLIPCMNAWAEDYNEHYYFFNDSKSTVKVSFNDILCFTSALHHVEILTKDNIFSVRSTLNKIINDLPDTFVRCHRSSIVNLKHVYRIAGTEITLSNRKKLTISRSYLANVQRKFARYAVRMKSPLH